jgi:hypothetical protein
MTNNADCLDPLSIRLLQRALTGLIAVTSFGQPLIHLRFAFVV